MRCEPSTAHSSAPRRSCGPLPLTCPPRGSPSRGLLAPNQARKPLKTSRYPGEPPDSPVKGSGVRPNGVGLSRKWPPGAGGGAPGEMGVEAGDGRGPAVARRVLAGTPGVAARCWHAEVGRARPAAVGSARPQAILDVTRPYRRRSLAAGSPPRRPAMHGLGGGSGRRQELPRAGLFAKNPNDSDGFGSGIGEAATKLCCVPHLR
jgi:hypothetical protein